MSLSDDIRLVQEDCYGAVLAHAPLATVAVVLERRAQTEQEIKQLLSARTARGGKVGLCILVQRPVFYPEANDPTLRGRLVQAFTVIEHPAINAGDLGTGISAEEAAGELVRLFAFASRTRPEQAFTPLPDPIVPDDSFAGFNAWEARVQTFISLGQPDRVGVPLIEPDSGAGTQTVTLTTGTAGAEIYYTLDGSYPYAGNPAAVLYSAPFVPGAGKTLRCAAEKAGLHQSGLSQVNFT